ncbi:MAG: hypothetical protein ACRD3W_01135, partial [Terriglobales bacterium]
TGSVVEQKRSHSTLASLTGGLIHKHVQPERTTSEHLTAPIIIPDPVTSHRNGAKISQNAG